MTSPIRTDDLRITHVQEVISPLDLTTRFPITEHVAQLVFDTRSAIQKILQGEDDRLLVIIGPCSIHDPKSAKEYAQRLKAQIDTHQRELLIVMRVYFEKPRTTVGWKGLINDPDLDETFQINKGLQIARKLLLQINGSGVPAATEFLDLISPQYVADLISWGAIGARTTESQGHRELASGLSCPIGFKNGTDGGFKVAIDAILAAEHSHIFMGLNKEGHSAILTTSGNNDCHIILRGGNDRPNYDEVSICDAVNTMKKNKVRPNVMVDFSHANSRKNHKRQVDVAENIANQVAKGNPYIMGVMIESHLQEGRQDVVIGKPLTYGQSITDACIGWDDSLYCLGVLAESVKQRRSLSSEYCDCPCGED